jgi:hypothetical protein
MQPRGVRHKKADVDADSANGQITLVWGQPSADGKEAQTQTQTQTSNGQHKQTNVIDLNDNR